MKKVSSTAVWVVIAILLLLVSVFAVNRENKSEAVPFSKFEQMFKADQIKSINMENDDASISFESKEGDKYTTVGNKEALMALKAIAPNNTAELNFEKPSSGNMWFMIIPIVIGIILMLLMVFMFSQQSQGGGGGRGVMNFGKNKAKMASPDSKQVTFKDVAGADEEKAELEEIVDFLRNPSRYTEMGARIPKGVLLVGPPGTGKTLLAKAIAGEAGVPFFSISGSDFVEMFVGVGASRVRDLFLDAKKNAPCIVFIDEIDAVGRQRGAGLGGGHDEREQTLNQLLVEMDGFGMNEGIIMIAATNRPDILDKALLRPGRFDRQIVVGAPDVKGREEVLKVHTRKKPLDSEVDLAVLAKMTVGFTGADLENLTNEAALLAVRREKKRISMNELEDAITKVIAGPEKKSRVIKEDERKLTAYHEAGHALVARLIEGTDPVHEISIIPRGMAGGYTLQLPEGDKSYLSKNKMKDEMAILLGGRVAEQLILGDISTGAKSDLDRTSSIARGMVMEYGMSEELGAVVYGADHDEVFLGRDLGRGRNFSEEVGAKIDREIKRFIDEAYERVEDLLSSNINKLHAVALALIEKEKLDQKQFEEIFLNS